MTHSWLAPDKLWVGSSLTRAATPVEFSFPAGEIKVDPTQPLKETLLMSTTRVAMAVLVLVIAARPILGQSSILKDARRKPAGFNADGTRTFNIGSAKASYDAEAGTASIQLPAAEVAKLLDAQLNTLEGYQINKDTETCYIKNFVRRSAAAIGSRLKLTTKPSDDLRPKTSSGDGLTRRGQKTRAR